MHRSRTVQCGRVLAGATVLALVASLGGVAMAQPDRAPTPKPVNRANTKTITLITGDRVQVFSQPGGQPAVGIEPAPGREHLGFLRDSRTGGPHSDLSVIPADAAPLLAAGQLDPRLFNVTELVRQGFTDAAAPALPLIVSYSGPQPRRAAAGETTRALPSVNGAAVRQDRKRGSEFWNWLTASRGSVAKVWLDAVAQPTLDASVAQIGAPGAWQSGLTGAGVTVGVLDTGIRADHPDLAGKVVEAKDFTGSQPNANDDVGHGTHVAGIIAGSGAASGGKYRGVVPDAKLVSGKVCLSFGCPDSLVIAGMEWIAAKAKVVNLSLGSTATDGTDPVSQALNALSAQHGTLFVVAAGNDRTVDAPDPVESVTAPAVADTALAVGSVTKQDETSPFSNRGPRLGDYAVKPDLAGPGSGIVSARAAGTPSGDLDPVDAHYARLSGTSMAAPHVAGAAAMLVQQHPDWNAGRLRQTLMSTAKPTAGVFDQGAGRVDAARAVTQQVSAAAGSLSFGAFSWPYPQPVTKTVSYRNDSDQPVTLTLATTTGPFTASASQISLPAKGSAEVGVTVNPHAGGSGLFGGRLTATADGITVQTALSAYLEPESYNLTVRLVSRTGRFTTGIVKAVNTDTGAAFGIRPFSADGTAVARLPKGRYDLNAIELSQDPANQRQPQTVTLLSRPDLVLGQDSAVTLDARLGKPVGAAVDRPDAQLQYGELGLVSGTAAGDRTSALAWFARPEHQLYAVSSGRKVTGHTYAFFFRATLAPAPLGGAAVPYLYQLAFLERGQIPANPKFPVRNRDLATVDAQYAVQGAPSSSFRADHARLPVPGAEVGVFPLYPHALPGRRTEYFTANSDVTWQHVLAVIPPVVTDSEAHWSIRSYAPGSYQAGWNRAPIGPAFGRPSEGWGVSRAGGLFAVAVPLLSGSDPAQYTSPPAGMTGTTTLSRDGVDLGSSPQPGFGVFPVPDSPGTYTLRSTAVREVPWSVVGTRAEVTWTFRDPGPTATTPLPLMVVRAQGEVDDQSRAPAGRGYVLTLTAQGQPGAPAVRLAGLTVDASFDDGRTWTPAPTLRIRDGGYAVLRHPDRPGFVSLRISARDTSGNTVVQTVTRAYQTQ